MFYLRWFFGASSRRQIGYIRGSVRKISTIDRALCVFVVNGEKCWIDDEQAPVLCFDFVSLSVVVPIINGFWYNRPSSFLSKRKNKKEKKDGLSEGWLGFQSFLFPRCCPNLRIYEAVVSRIHNARDGGVSTTFMSPSRPSLSRSDQQEASAVTPRSTTPAATTTTSQNKATTRTRILCSLLPVVVSKKIPFPLSLSLLIRASERAIQNSSKSVWLRMRLFRTLNVCFENVSYWLVDR